ncbi:MAG: PAS domain S-box protein [Cyclobacteriaceae bacterium]|nr:PAS domain S-box protein [Cyclobacteriaceae bacterium]
MKKEAPIQISYTNLLSLIINPDGQIRFITKPMASLLGYTIEELIGININKLFEADELKKLKNLISTINDLENLEFLNFPSLILTKTNTSLDLNLKVIQLKNNLLNNYAYAILSDNTIYRNFVKKVLKSSKHNLQELYKIANELIFILDINKNIIFLSEKWQSNLGINISLKSKQTLDTLFNQKLTNTIKEELQKLTLESSIKRLEIKVESNVNEKTYYFKGYLLLEQKDGHPFIYQCIFNDITEEVRSKKVKNLYFNISNQIAENTNLQTVYKNIHEELKEVISCNSLYIALYNPDDEVENIHFPYFLDKDKTTKSGLLRPAGNGITEYAIKYGQPLSLTKQQLLALERKNEIEILGNLPEHWLGVPLHTPNKVIGVIAIQSYTPEFSYNDADLKILDFASSQIAMAIEMAQTREELQNQTAQLNAIFDSSSHLIWSVNRELEVTSYNKNYIEANFINHDIQSPDNEDELSKIVGFKSFWEEKYERAFKGEKLQFEINLKDDHNNIIWKEVHLNPIYTRSNTISEVSGIAQDITPKKHSEIALLKSEEKFRNIFESFQDLYFRCNLHGSILMVSPSISDLLGYQPFEVLGKHIDDYYLYNPRAKKILSELKTEKNLKNVEVSIVKQNGEVRQCICNVRMVQNNKNEPYEVEGVVRDITQLKITNQQLINANDIAENSLRVKEQFLANMSHEIRTPMNGIIGMIDLLDESTLGKSQKGYVSTLKKSSAILMDILNDILDLAKIEAGRMELKKSTFSLPYIVDKIHALFTPIASTNQVNLHYHINKTLPHFINTDETKLIQVLSNLISNSLKFTQKGGSIDIGFELIDDMNNQALIRVDVRDSGIGISEENQKLLFKSFEQIDVSTTKSYAGTGLGLAISKQLVTLLGGQIGVFSNPGLGSTFWFTFRASFPKEQKEPKKTITIENTYQTTSDLTQKQILIVDDNSINREVAKEILKKTGCSVQLAESGEAAIELVTQHNFDIILMDIQMPGMDGIKTTQKIRALNLDTMPKIIAMTAYAMKEDKERFLKLGMDDYLPKPIRAITLINKVSEQASKEEEMHEDLKLQKVAEIINIEVVRQLKKYGGEEILDSVYDEFSIETEVQLNECQSYFNKKEWEEIKKVLHTIKGTSGTLGINRIAQTAQKLEAMVKQNNISDFETNLLKLMDNFEEYKTTYKEIIKNY